MSFYDQESLEERADQLEARNLNGLDFVLVTLPETSPSDAHLELHFHNDLRVTDILASPSPAKVIFPISGGHRVRAGAATGEVQVHDILPHADGNVLQLIVSPIGDYSTYTLSIQFAGMDPVFTDLEFRFRPGCFSLCKLEGEKPPAPKDEPLIDYLAKDFDSFRHVLMTAMQARVSGWEPTSEVDLSQTMISLFSAAADELSDHQDRVMNEAYLASARNRISVARHARLMDYHVHQGNQADTWLAAKLQDGIIADLPIGFEAWTGGAEKTDSSVVFLGRSQQPMHHLLNSLRLYTWGGTRPGLAAGATSAELELAVGGQGVADTVRDLILDGTVDRLLIQEHLNPVTLRTAGRNPSKRQLLHLVADSATSAEDPVTTSWYVRVSWREEDRLRHDYCCSVLTDGGRSSDQVSLFHGNLVKVFHGRPNEVVFKHPDTLLTTPSERHYQPTRRWGTICQLPSQDPLLYRETKPRSEEIPLTSLDVASEARGEEPRTTVIPPGNPPEVWEETISLVNRKDDDAFAVETDELGRSRVRFGNGVNGKELPEGSEVRCWYQTGDPLDGNIGTDRLEHFDSSVHPDVAVIWNPFDVTNGREPEPRDEILRNVPEAFRTRQLRAISLADYVARAEELPGVSRAAARYTWTGSWRTVQIAIDPQGTDALKPELRLAVARYLEAVRLIGEDLEVRGPKLVPLTIVVKFCVEPEVWPEDVRSVLELEFSDGYTPDGRPGFFHPDRWTFGQYLRSSEILGRLQQVPGIDHAISVSVERFDAVTPGTGDLIEMGANEIIQVRNDPDHMELGRITFDPRGGRQ